jgi:hypothetical protein
MRKRTRRRVVVAQLPPGMRPKLTPQQLVDLGLVHHQLLAAVATGQATSSTLWEYAGCVLTWWHVSRLARAGMPEMDAQCELVISLTQRWRRTGRVAFTGPELQLARDGVVYMDQLAELVTDLQARAAALLSEAQLAALKQGQRPPALPTPLRDGQLEQLPAALAPAGDAHAC